MARLTAHSTFTRSSRTSRRTSSTSEGSRSMARWTSMMATCSAPSDASTLARTPSSWCTESSSAASRRPSSASTSSGETLRRGVRTLRRSTVQQRPTAMPGEAGSPWSVVEPMSALPESRLEDLGQRLQGLGGVLPLADHHHDRPLARRQREHAHDALRVDLEAVLLELDVAPEAVRGLHHDGGRPRVQPQRVDDGEASLDAAHHHLAP